LPNSGRDFSPRPAPDLAAYQKAEIEIWWPIIKAAGIKGVKPSLGDKESWLKCLQFIRRPFH
jgi:hypothetical protein